MKKKFYLISLGCAKNTVDSESMASLLLNNGYTTTEKRGEADFLIVNTCGFIGPARQESIDTLKDLARRKKKGQMLIAAGCLTERYREQIALEVKGIDGILGTRRWMDIVDLASRLRPGSPEPLYHLPNSPTVGMDEKGVLRTAVQGASAYLKIADGCRRPCAFCAIPLIKGTAVSRPPEAIVNEAKLLQLKGVKELILIAQDTTDYGHDLGLKDGLSLLVEQIAFQAPTIPWIRLLYAYPGYVTERLMEVIANTPQVVPYLDMPLQHAHPKTLLRMRRPANMDWVRRTLAQMRAAIPALALRTTFIVGYPGETEEEFQTLLNFLREIQFDHIGLFKFSFEIGTPSEPLGDPIPDEVKENRLQQLATLQESISLARNQTYVGKIQPVLIEGQSEGISIGRATHDAPEIDGLVLVEGEAPIGEIVSVLITGAMTHDLSGRLIR